MKKLILFLILFALIFMWSCDEEIIRPIITNLSPGEFPTHFDSFTLIVSGNNFIDGATIHFNGYDIQAAFVSSNELRCQITPDHTVNTTNPETISDDTDIDVLIRNPGSDGGESHPYTFTLLANPRFKTPFTTFSSGSSYSFEEPALFYADNGRLHLIYKRAGTNTKWNPWYGYTDDLGESRSNHEAFVEDNNFWRSKYASIVYNPVRDMLVVVAGDMGSIISAWKDSTSHSGYYIISSKEGDRKSPALTIDDNGKIHLIYYVNDNSNSYHRVVYTNTTNTFKPRNAGAWAREISDGSRFARSSSQQSIATNGTNLYVTWYEEDDQGWQYLMFSRSTDGGETWSTPHNLGHFPCLDPLIVSDDGSNVYIIFRDQYEDEVRCTYSSDGGINWSAVSTIAQSQENCNYPSISIDSMGNINVVWSAEPNWDGITQIMFSRSTDGGENWTTPSAITVTEGSSLYPAIASNDDKTIFIVWSGASQSQTGYDLFFSRNYNSEEYE